MSKKLISNNCPTSFSLREIFAVSCSICKKEQCSRGTGIICPITAPISLLKEAAANFSMSSCLTEANTLILLGSLLPCVHLLFLAMVTAHTVHFNGSSWHNPVNVTQWIECIIHSPSNQLTPATPSRQRLLSDPVFCDPQF